MTSKMSDYVIPDGTTWDSPPCSGAVGSKPNLVNIQTQIEENRHAVRENRKARALAIPCPFCGSYHIEMQPPVNDLIGGEVNDDFKEDVPAPVRTVLTDPETVANAIDAATGSSDSKTAEEDPQPVKDFDPSEVKKSEVKDDDGLDGLLASSNKPASKVDSTDSAVRAKSSKPSSGSTPPSSSSR